jgi:hypothetical protein
VTEHRRGGRRSSPGHPPSHRLTLDLLPGNLAICLLPPDAATPQWALASSFSTVSRTTEELSVIVPEDQVPPEVKCEKRFRALKVRGPLEFNAVGILASLAGPLAETGVSIIAISTYLTDYILVRQEDLEWAVKTLQNIGHIISPET